MSRFHEQLKAPTTPAHDRACIEVMKMPTYAVLGAFFPKRDPGSFQHVELTWFPAEPVRESHRGNLTGFVDLAALVTWKSADGEDQGGYIGIEVKTSAASIGNAVRQVKTYRGGLVRCSHIPMDYGQVQQHRVRSCQLRNVALALPQGTITEEVRLLTTGVPLIEWPADEFGPVSDPLAE